MLHLALRLRIFFLSGIFNFLTNDCLWNKSHRAFFDTILLDNETHPTATQKEAAILAGSSPIRRPLYRLFFSIARSGEQPFHINIPQYIVLHLHKATGLIDPTLTSHVDDHIHSYYAPLHHFIAMRTFHEQWEELPGTTCPIFRFSKDFPSVTDLSAHTFKGFTRSFHIYSDTDFSLLYYDVLQRNSRAIADEATIAKIKQGEVNAIAISYRHCKDHREKLGISKKELLLSLRALHQEALQAGPVEMYCIWWDSVLKCQPRPHGEMSNWAAIGLASYAYCHVLSVRRENEGEFERYWIDIERALASLRSGITAVSVCKDGRVEILGGTPERQNYPQEALMEALRYAVSGDLFESQVTFESDRRKLRAVGLKLLCQPLGLGAVRALRTKITTDIIEVDSWDLMEDTLFMTVLTVRLGYEASQNGEGEEFLDEGIYLRQSTVIGDRRNWLPNADIYDVDVNDSSLLPEHMREQQVALLLIRGKDNEILRFGLQLFYKQEDVYNFEAVHGCLSSGSFCNNEWRVERVSRIFIPCCSQLLNGFKELCGSFKDYAGRKLEIIPHLKEIDHSVEALQWLSSEIQPTFQTSSYHAYILPHGATTKTFSQSELQRIL